MTGLIFWDVDTQYDFMHPDGKLYVPESESIIPNLRKLSAGAHAAGIRVVASADVHQLDHQEISDSPDFKDTFPPHCMKGTPGQEKIPETALVDPLVIEPDPMDELVLRRTVGGHSGDVLFHKHWFDVFTNPNVRTAVDELSPTAIVLYGVALDVCDRYAIEGLLLHRPDTHLSLVTDAAKPIDAEQGRRLIGAWERRGVEMITTEQALARAHRGA
jgi:nicotinamidase/pyrazinamidase